MADEPKKQTYPKIPTKSWYALRQRVRTSPSTRLTADTVAAMLGLGSPSSAQTNILRPMNVMGLIDENGALTTLGQKWRVDASYADVCAEIIGAVYPEGLRSLTDGEGKASSENVATWFEHRGFGSSNVQQMTSTFMLLADPHAEPVDLPDRATAKATAAKPQRPRASKSYANGTTNPAPAAPVPTTTGGDRRPDLHIDLIDALLDIADPAVRAKAAEEAIAELRDLMARLATIREGAVAQLRVLGFSHAEVADELDVSRTRAQQLAKAAQDIVDVDAARAEFDTTQKVRDAVADATPRRHLSHNPDFLKLSAQVAERFSPDHAPAFGRLARAAARVDTSAFDKIRAAAVFDDVTLDKLRKATAVDAGVLDNLRKATTFDDAMLERLRRATQIIDPSVLEGVRRATQIDPSVLEGVRRATQIDPSVLEGVRRLMGSAANPHQDSRPTTEGHDDDDG